MPNGERLRWRRDGREIVFFATAQLAAAGGGRQIVSVPVTWTSSGPEFGAPHTLVTAPANSAFGTMFDVTPDGQRFVVVVDNERDQSPITVRLNRNH